MAIAAGAVDDAVDANGRAKGFVEDEVLVNHEVTVAQAAKARISWTSATFCMVGEGLGGGQDAID